jgi:hypothetical protein
MAKLTFIPGVDLPVNRRGGLVHYATPTGVNVARSLSIPLQPKNVSANLQQLFVANLSIIWKGLDSATKAEWTATAPNSTTGYGWFVAYNSAIVEQGYLPVTDPPILIVFTSSFAFTPTQFGTTPQTLINVIMPTAPDSPGDWDITVYIQLSDLSPFWVNGAADGAPVGQAPASGYVFLMTVRGLPPNYIGTLDISAEVEALFGQPLTPITVDAINGMYYGSWVSLGVYMTKAAVEIGVISYGTSPPTYDYGPFYNPAY